MSAADIAELVGYAVGAFGFGYLFGYLQVAFKKMMEQV